MNTHRTVLDGGVDSVVENGYCIGCGACAGLRNPIYQVTKTKYGTLEARKVRKFNDDEYHSANRVCPFSNYSTNEDKLSEELFPNCKMHEKLGRYKETYAGYVLEGDYRKNGSSGGIGTWLLEKLFTEKLVDGVVHVGNFSNSKNDLMYGYKISRNIEDIRNSRKSKYYPITLADIVKEVRKNPGRYVFSGVPCFIKAIRLLAKEDRDFGQSVTYCMGLICGHLKSIGFCEFLSWQMGIKPQDLDYFDFRVKIDNKPASKYGVCATGFIDGLPISKTEAMDNLFGKDWGMGLFKIKACDYCDDVVSETADITIGDAWLPQYVSDHKGTNIVVVRDEMISKLLDKYRKLKVLNLDIINPDEVVRSQGSGYSHRREGLAYRLWLADSNNLWRPNKRIHPKKGMFQNDFEKRHRLRMDLAEISHTAYLEAKANDDISIFYKKVVPISDKYIAMTYSPINKLRRKIKQILNRYI